MSKQEGNAKWIFAAVLAAGVFYLIATGMNSSAANQQAAAAKAAADARAANQAALQQCLSAVPEYVGKMAYITTAGIEKCKASYPTN